MARLQRFEDIEAWKMSRELTKRIYQVSSIGAFAKDFGLKDQIRRASVSVMSNIAEGFERRTDKEFCQFLSIAKGSAGEIKAQLYIALDVGFISQTEFNDLYEKADKTGKMIGGFMKYLNEGRVRSHGSGSHGSRVRESPSTT
jgi:four helix bundle protein